MSPRRNWPSAKPQRPKEPETPKPAHRPIADIKRDIANAPAQALPPLQAELIAALDAERRS